MVLREEGVKFQEMGTVKDSKDSKLRQRGNG